jgi:hypothetical protein
MISLKLSWNKEHGTFLIHELNSVEKKSFEIRHKPGIICREWYLTFRHKFRKKRHPGRLPLILLPFCSPREDRIGYIQLQIDGDKECMR